jgi:CubicO group peptidase (beta-lactamase class C family)
MNRSFVLKTPVRLLLLWLPLLLLAASPKSQTAPDLRTKSDAYLSALVPQGFSGAVLIAQDGEIILEKGYGLAVDEGERPFTADTAFVIGSISKSFTAAAILHLEMQGRLHTTDPISKFITNVPPDKAPITLHHLLTHTAGLPQHHAASDFEPLTRDEALAVILEKPLRFQPGEEYAYSDAGYVMLAAIVELVSGGPFTGYLVEHLFEPAGMRNTGFYDDPRWQTLPLAHGYYNGQDKGSPAEWPGPYWSLLGTGGIVSTVGDLYRWQQALAQQRILSPAMMKKLWMPYATINERTSYGYGWQISQTEYGGQLIWHVGAGRAHNAEFRYFPETGTVIIIGSNRIDDVYLGIGRIYETFHEVIYANEIGKTLSRNVLNNDFQLQPNLKLPDGFFISMPDFIVAVTLTLLLILLIARRWRQRIRG